MYKVVINALLFMRGGGNEEIKTIRVVTGPKR